MAINRLRVMVTIDGLSIRDGEEEDAIGFLKGWVKEETKAGLLGHQRGLFNWQSEEDIEVEIYRKDDQVGGGTLLCAAQFSSSKSVEDDDTLEITHTISAVDDYKEE